MAMTETEKQLADQIYAAVQQMSNGTERAQQQRDFTIGVSDIGTCPERVRRMLAGIPEPVTDKLEAAMGTAVGAYAEAAVAAMYPEAITQATVSLTLQGELHDYELTGHPDIVMPWGVVDCKTADGLEEVRRNGPTFSQLVQRHAYAKGAHDAGYLSVPLEEVKTANVWIDRSGRTKEFFVHMDTFNPGILIDAGFWLDEAYYAYEHGLAADKTPPREWCRKACFAAETEVPTRYGIRQIGDLAGSKHQLLVPAIQMSGLSGHADWREVEVRAFGVQPLRKVTLTRRRAKKIIYTTGEHQWFVREPGASTRTQKLVVTDDLQPGMALRSMRKRNSGGVEQVPVAVLHGFTYGDGSRSGSRGGSVSQCQVYISDNSRSKSQVMLPRFFGHLMTRSQRDDGWDVRGLPSLWKDAPNLEESLSYLTSWLCGYFAADGSVMTNGKCSMSSTRYGSIQLIRSICSMVGISTGPVQIEERAAGSGIKGDSDSTLYRVTLNRSTFPDWFLLHPHHREYAARQATMTSAPWRVESVERTDRVEEVYCAVVPGSEAFVLTEDVLTHNCGHFEDCRLYDSDVTGLITDQKVLTAIEMYQEGKVLVKEGDRLKDEAKPILEGIEGYTDQFQIRWTHVNETVVPSFVRRAGDRLNITKRKGVQLSPAKQEVLDD